MTDQSKTGQVGSLLTDTCSESFPAWLHDYFRALRFNRNHHLGLGDIRLTLSQQDDLVVAAERANVGKRPFTPNAGRRGPEGASPKGSLP